VIDGMLGYVRKILGVQLEVSKNAGARFSDFRWWNEID
jgi:hypothetical protein